MSVAAAVRMDSPDAEAIVARAAYFAERAGEDCYVISVFGAPGEMEETVVTRNLQVIASYRATPVMQEADEIPQALISVARWFGVRTLFLQNGRRRLFGRSLAQQLLALSPPFEVVVIERSPRPRGYTAGESVRRPVISGS